MVFNKHEKLEGLHAPFSASKSSWLRYESIKACKPKLSEQNCTNGQR